MEVKYKSNKQQRDDGLHSDSQTSQKSIEKGLASLSQKMKEDFSMVADSVVNQQIDKLVQAGVDESRIFQNRARGYTEMLENNAIDCLHTVADDAIDVLKLEFWSIHGEVIKMHEIDADNKEL